MRLLDVGAVAAAFFLGPLSFAADPYARMQLGRLSNGIPYVLAPSTSATSLQIKIVYNVGHYSEEPGARGTAHLLEHVMFLDPRLGSQTTYLNLIKEKGGVGNAFTNSRQTGYWAVLPPHLAEWGIDIFARMLVNKKLDEKLVQKEKSVVFQEIGRPSFPDYLGARLDAFLDKVFRDEFRETELGVREPFHSPGAVRTSTTSLTALDLQRFYKKYYHAANMTIYVAGNFDPVVMGNALERRFKAVPRDGERGYVERPTLARLRPYYRSQVAHRREAEIQMGFKLHKLSYAEELIGRIYFEDLALRLQKIVRNQKGESYSVQTCSEVAQGFGQMSVCLDTTADAFSKNRALVEKILRDEIFGANLTEAAYAQAYKLFGDAYRLAGKDTSAQMRLAEEVGNLQLNYPQQAELPYAVYAKVDYETYRATLRKILKADLKYEKARAPALLFRFEIYVVLIFALGLATELTERLFRRRFPYAQVRGVRNLVRMPWSLVEISCAICAAAATFLFHALVKFLWFKTGLLAHHFVVSEYLPLLLSVPAFPFFLQVGCATYLKKIIFCEDRLFLKSIGYFSYEIPYSEIQSCEILTEWQIGKSWRRLRKVKYRYYHFGEPWKKAIYLELRDGRAFFMRIKNTEDAFRELQEFREASRPRPVADSLKLVA